jgi:major membrane immunogen (membrane-anchored lipoprotein)
MKGGRAVDVHYDEFKPGEDYGKRNDGAYAKTMTRMTGKMTLAEAFPILEGRFLEVQDPLKVDSVSGATLASYRFRITLLKAIYESRTKRALNAVAYDWKGK